MSLTEQGFERPSYNEILEAQINRAKTLFGETIDTSELSALGKYIRINVADLDNLYQVLEGVYYARFPNTATGVSLDRLCPFAGITRKPASYATHRILIRGVVGAVIGVDFEVATENQSATFHLTDYYTIGSNGTVTAVVECNEAGTVGNVASTAINTIVNPLADVDSVEGIEIVSYGEERESDVSLRKRFMQGIAGSGSGTAAAIESAVMRVAGVGGCSILVNVGDTTAASGLPPHCFTCYVQSDETPATDMLIAKAIFSKKPLGIGTYGSVEVDVVDDSQNVHTIAFERVTRKDVYINIAIKTTDDFIEDYEDTIKENLIEYISGLSNGEYVYFSQLYPCINVTGVRNVETLELSDDGETYSGQIPIVCRFNEIARTSADKITITATHA